MGRAGQAAKRIGPSWAGPIPIDWDIVRAKHLSTIYAGGTPDRNRSEYWEGGTIPWLNSGEVNQWLITEPSTLITEEGLRNSSTKWIPRDALVMALAGQGKTKGMVGQLGIEATCNQSMAAIVPVENVHPRFIQWWLHANYETIRNLAGGEQRDGLNLEIVGNIPCPKPSIAVQRAIANYLDRETARLDALVAAKERVLGLLAEKRQALITRAVTRGLGPGTPLRDSGLPWLGEIPAHWRLAGFTKYLRSLVDYRGKTPEKSANGVFLVTARNIRSGYIDYAASEEYVEATDYEEAMRRGKPKLGDLLLTTEAPLGQAAIVDREDIALAQRVIKLDYDPRVLLNAFVLQWILATPLQYQLSSLATGSTALGIKGERLHMLRTAIPPVNEQQAIVAYIAAETSKLEEVRLSTERTIRLLKERRAALIVAAVTGQIVMERAV
jgi:type I restriction enzyme, S subunit